MTAATAPVRAPSTAPPAAIVNFPAKAMPMPKLRCPRAPSGLGVLTKRSKIRSWSTLVIPAAVVWTTVLEIYVGVPFHRKARSK